MAKVLEGQIPQLAKAVAREEVPHAEWETNGSGSSRRTTRKPRSGSRSSSGSRSTGRSRARSGSRSS
jgi:hypothetical protein